MNDTRAMSTTSMSVKLRKPILNNSIPSIQELIATHNRIDNRGDAFHFPDIVNADDACSVHDGCRNSGSGTFHSFVHRQIQNFSDKRFPGRPGENRVAESLKFSKLLQDRKVVLNCLSEKF